MTKKSKPKKDQAKNVQPAAGSQSGVHQPPQTAREFTLPEAIGALLYYDEPKTEEKGGKTFNVSFEKIPEEEKRIWYRRGEVCLLALDRLNKRIVKKVSDVEQERTYNDHVQRLAGIIRAFLAEIKKGNKNKDRVIISLFPCEELAHRIIGPGPVKG